VKHGSARKVTRIFQQKTSGDNDDGDVDKNSKNKKPAFGSLVKFTYVKARCRYLYGSIVYFMPKE
jgi:hypothetical protein